MSLAKFLAVGAIPYKGFQMAYQIKSAVLVAFCSLVTSMTASTFASTNCSEAGPRSCLQAFYSTLPNGQPPSFNCGGTPGFTCLPQERDVTYQGPVPVSPGWHTLPDSGFFSTAQIKVPIGCVQDVTTGEYTCLYPASWDNVDCMNSRNPLTPRNCP